jgi:hypothetical protein
MKPEKITALSRRCSRVLRIGKIVFGILIIIAFFLPWAVQTEGCADDAVVVRENITGFSLAIEGIAPGAVLSLVAGAILTLSAFFIRGDRRPFLRSLTSIGEGVGSFLAIAYVSFEIFFLSEFREQIGFFITYILMMYAVPIAALFEVFSHFPLLTRKGRLVIIGIFILYLLYLIIDVCFYGS